MAFQRGEDSDEAMVGALIRADEAACLRHVRSFLVSLGGRRG